ncbi:MAG: hypothetical protein U0792_11470 [Gemmataceae bacterium]
MVGTRWKTQQHEQEERWQELGLGSGRGNGEEPDHGRATDDVATEELLGGEFPVGNVLKNNATRAPMR